MFMKILCNFKITQAFKNIFFLSHLQKSFTGNTNEKSRKTEDEGEVFVIILMSINLKNDVFIHKSSVN